jgi:hypothetical protein
MKEVNFSMPTPEILENLSREPKIKKIYDESKLLDAIEKVERRRYMPSEKNKKEHYIKYFVGEWISQKIREEYQELHPDIFEITRNVSIKPEKIYRVEDSYRRKEEVEENNETFNVEIPMFAVVDIEEKNGWSKKVEIDDETRVYLSAEKPHIPLDIAQKRKDALKLVYRTYASALENELIGEIIFENPSYAPKPSDSRLLVLWKPKPSEIDAKVEVIDNDPALVLKYGNPYLVSTWLDSNEESIVDIVNACRITHLERFFGEK